MLAILANLTALQRIVFTRRVTREPSAAAAGAGARRRASLLGAGTAGAGRAARPVPSSRPRPSARGRGASRPTSEGDPGPVVGELGRRRARAARSATTSAICRRRAGPARRPGRRARDGARASPSAIRESRLAPRALLMAATLAARAGDDAGAQALLDAADRRAIPTRPSCRRRSTCSARRRRRAGSRDDAAHAYRELRVLAPTTGWADGASDRLAVLAAAGVPVPALTTDQRLERAERLLRGGVPRPPPTRRSGSPARRATRPSSCARCGSSRTARSGWAATTSRPRARRRCAIPRRRPSGARRSGSSRRGCSCARRQATSARWTILARVAGVGLGGRGRRGAVAARARARGRAARRPTRWRRTARWSPRAIPKREVAGGRAVAARLARLPQGRRAGREQSTGRGWRSVAGGRAYRLPALYWDGARPRGRSRDRAAAEPLYAQVLAEAPRSYYGVLAGAGAARASAQAAGSASVTLPADPARRPRRAIPGFARVDLLRRLGLVESALEELEDVVAARDGRHRAPLRASRAPTCATSATTWRCASSAATSPGWPPPAIRRCRARSGRCSIPSAGAREVDRGGAARRASTRSWSPRSCARSRATTRARSRGRARAG